MTDSTPLTRNAYPDPEDAPAIRSAWAAEGYDFHEMTDPPGQRWDGFVHATDELLTVARGRLECEIEGETLVAGPGDRVFIPARAVHSVRNIASGRTRWFFGYR